jgi:hypothetical protein
MQIYTAGTNPLFWKQIGQLPEGLQNREYNQAPSLPIPVLLVDFLDYPVGTVLDMYVGGVKQGQVKVMDATGFVYGEVNLPNTHNQDAIDLQLRIGALIVSSATFSTSNIDMTFDVAARLSHQVWEDSEQLKNDATILGVESSLLEGKFGVFTGLQRRTDQTLDEYRLQTACLWKAFQYAGTVKALVDSLKCLLGDVAIMLDYTRDDIGNRVFDNPQYGPNNNGALGDPYLPFATMKRTDIDNPHYYVADVPVAFRDYTEYPTGQSPIEVLTAGGTDITPDGWTTPDHFLSMTIRTIQAIGNEVFALIDEADAVVAVTDNLVRRDGTAIDNLGNQNVAGPVTIAGYTEGPDYTVNALTGEITWITPMLAGTAYDASYSFRLDNAISIVVKQIKPAQRSVVILFTPRLPGSILPKAIEL